MQGGSERVVERLPGQLPERAELLSCAVETHESRVFLRPSGELDCWTVGALEEQLCEVHAAGFDPIELDLGSLSFCDSTGVALVVKWSQRSAEQGFLLRVTAGTGEVRRLFEMTAITHLLADAAPRGRLL
jgi:anti-anti-sigma factor